MGQKEKTTLPCDRRYRTSRYFLQDQLQYSEAAADFRSVKQLLDTTPSFTLRHAFRFQAQPAVIRTDG